MRLFAFGKPLCGKPPEAINSEGERKKRLNG